MATMVTPQDYFNRKLPVPRNISLSNGINNQSEPVPLWAQIVLVALIGSFVVALYAISKVK